MKGETEESLLAALARELGDVEEGPLEHGAVLAEANPSRLLDDVERAGVAGRAAQEERTVEIARDGGEGDRRDERARRERRQLRREPEHVDPVADAQAAVPVEVAERRLATIGEAGRRPQRSHAVGHGDRAVPVGVAADLRGGRERGEDRAQGRAQGEQTSETSTMADALPARVPNVTRLFDGC